MVTRRVLAAVLGLGIVLAAPAAEARPSARKGKLVFQVCAVCHSLEPDGDQALGPHLVGLYGRTAGTIEGFVFSRTLAASGIVWDDATLRAYLKDPKAMVPRGKMPYAGIAEASRLDNLMAYLEKATAATE